MPPEPVNKRAVAFFDGQNLFYAAKHAFGYTWPNYEPHKLAQSLCQTNGWDLVQTNFYTGIPSVQDDPTWNHFWTAKLAQMGRVGNKLKKTLNAYHNRAIATQEVIEELIKLAKEMDAATKRGEDLGLTDDEVAFYDALATNESAVQAMGDAKLKVIAGELITKVRKSVTIDWTLRESARAKIKVIVKRILNQYGYPPDLQEEAVKTVLQQAELLCADWAGEVNDN